MLWLLFSGICCWLALREVVRRWIPREGYERPDSTPVSKAYLAIMCAFAFAFAFKPIQTWQFERFLSARAKLLAESPMATVHCNTVFDTFFDSNSLAPGHATPETGRIVLQYPWCKRLREHLADPNSSNRQGIFSVQLFVHETMHIRGEMNEARTECQAIQRHYRGAKLLGIPEELARHGALSYYNNDYKRRSGIDGLGGQYFTEHCAPGRALDESLPDSSWNNQAG